MPPPTGRPRSAGGGSCRGSPVGTFLRTRTDQLSRLHLHQARALRVRTPHPVHQVCSVWRA